MILRGIAGGTDITISIVGASNSLIYCKFTGTACIDWRCAGRKSCDPKYSSPYINSIMIVSL
jgi:hypothetical protein